MSESDVRQLFARPAEERMVADYEVGPEHVERLEAASGATLDLGELRYFVGPRSPD
jgi:hypothetical protein